MMGKQKMSICIIKRLQLFYCFQAKILTVFVLLVSLFLEQSLIAQTRLENSTSTLKIYTTPSSMMPIQKMWEEYLTANKSQRAEVVACPKHWTVWMLANSRCQIITHYGFLGKQDKKSLQKAFPHRQISPGARVANFSVAVVLNSRIPISSITCNQLSDILTGKVKNWKIANNSKQSVVIIGQDVHASSSYILQTRCQIIPSLFRKNIIKKQSMSQVIKAVQKTPGAIGFFLHPSPGDNSALQKNKKIKLLKIAPCDKYGKPTGEAVLPTTESLSKETYPLMDSLILVLHPNAPQEAHNFARFAKSEEGAKIARKYMLFPEYDRQKYFSEQRMLAAKKGKGTQVEAYGHKGGRLVLRGLVADFVRGYETLQVKSRRAGSRLPSSLSNE